MLREENMYQLEYLDLEENKLYEEIIKKVIKQCFAEENLENSKMYISITLTTPENIHEINKKYRNVDRETDVLSFPMFEKDELDEKREEGEALGENRINQLILKLSELNRTDEILKAAADREYQKKLLKEFGL